MQEKTATAPTHNFGKCFRLKQSISATSVQQCCFKDGGTSLHPIIQQCWLYYRDRLLGLLMALQMQGVLSKCSSLLLVTLTHKKLSQIAQKAERIINDYKKILGDHPYRRSSNNI
jgi:hypothetical protein